MRARIHRSVEKAIRAYASFLMEEDIKKLTNHIVDAIMEETFVAQR